MSNKDWEVLERDADRGFQTLAREAGNEWEVEVRFDDAKPPERASRTAATRDEAKKIGQEVFMANS